MRIGRRCPISGELSLVALALTLAGCSTSGENQFSTASLAPRPEEGMRRDAPRPYTAETESPKPYTQPAYLPPPPQQRAYQPYGQSQPYARPYGYGTQTAAGYGTQAPAQPYNYGNTPYRPAPYGQQQPYPASGMQTASVGGQGPMGQPPMGQPMPQAPYQQQPLQPAQAPAAYAPLTTGSLPRQTTTPLSNQGVYMVREGDTLFGISKRTGVPVKDLVTANNIQNNKISIGQQIKIPQKQAAR